jgi:putative DNA primase/helicase
VPFTFNPDAPPPRRWFAFLQELWGDDAETIAALQEMFGYLVSGDTRQQKMFLLVGPKRGGKGTIGRVLTRMIGRHNVAGPTLASLGTNFGLQDLIAKPVAVISDARIGKRSDGSLIAERLLSVSGEDLQNVDRKYLTPWSGYLPTRFVMLHKSFYDQEKPELTDELCGELPGIFNWSLDGLQRLRARARGFCSRSRAKKPFKSLRTWRARWVPSSGTVVSSGPPSPWGLTRSTKPIGNGAKIMAPGPATSRYSAET